MGAERIVLMTVHFSRWWNTPTVTSDSVLDVRTAEQRTETCPVRSVQVMRVILCRTVNRLDLCSERVLMSCLMTN